MWKGIRRGARVSVLFGFCCRASDYRSGITDLMPWLGKAVHGQGANHTGVRKEDGRRAELTAAMPASKRRRKQPGLLSFSRLSLVSCRERARGVLPKVLAQCFQSPWTRSEKGGKALLRRKQTTEWCDEGWLKFHRCSGTFKEHLRPNHSLYNPSLYEEGS